MTKHCIAPKMTYARAWQLTSESTYNQARREGWGEEWLSADEHIRLADYDLQTGVISDLSEYDAT